MVNREIIKDIWYPSNYNSPIIQAWHNFKLGIFIHFGLPTYLDDENYNINRLIYPKPVSTYNPPKNIESLVGGWITDIFSANDVDYLIVTASHQIGFRIYQSNIELPDSPVTDAKFGSVTLPLRSNYFDTKYDVLGVIANKCREFGKQLVIYYNIGRRINERGSNYYGDNQAFYNTTVLRLKELIIKYRPAGLWLDAPGQDPWGGNGNDGTSYMHQLYTSIKNIDNNILISINGTIALVDNGIYDEDGNLYIFPMDKLSYEKRFGTMSYIDYYKNDKRHHYGNNYYITSELLTTNNNEEIYFAAEDKGATWKSQAEIQANYNEAQSYGIPYVMNVSPSRAGILSSGQLSLIENLIL